MFFYTEMYLNILSFSACTFAGLSKKVVEFYYKLFPNNEPLPLATLFMYAVPVDSISVLSISYKTTKGISFYKIP